MGLKFFIYFVGIFSEYHTGNEMQIIICILLYRGKKKN